MSLRKTKVCPFCREEIDLLALKCLHCGERVGQPLGKERFLTEDDIGRPEDAKIEMSASVVSAYQQMQMKNTSDATPHKQALQPVPKHAARMKNIGFAIVAVVVMIGLFAAVDHVLGIVFGMEKSKRAAQSEALLVEAETAALSGDLVTAVKRGNEALTLYSANAETEQFVEELRQRLTDRAYELYDRDNLDAALQFCVDAIEADPTNTTLVNLRSTVNKEMQRNEVRLTAVTKGKAMFVKPDGSSVTLDVGYSMSDLGYKLKSVDAASGTAVLYDRHRDRDLIFHVHGGAGQALQPST